MSRKTITEIFEEMDKLEHVEISESLQKKLREFFLDEIEAEELIKPVT